MAAENNGQELELTNRIMEMVEGESEEVLQEIHNLLTYHMGYKAGIYNGDVTVRFINKFFNKL